MITNTQSTIAKLNHAAQENNAAVTTANIIKDLISKHRIDKFKEGERYYNNENDILKRIMYYFEGETKIEDNEATNNKIPHNWHKLLVDQKTGYLVGKPVSFAGDEKAAKDINDVLGDEFNDTVIELCKNASNKGIEWLHPYIDEDGNFDFVIIPAEESIPIWETSRQKKLEAFIRYYYIDIGEEKRIYVEYWTAETVEFYMQDVGGNFVLDDSEDENPGSHFYYRNKGYGWGKVPFIPFKNNEEALSDLKFYKELVDEYDKQISDLSNNLEDIQELIYILKGYEGTELKEFKNNLRRYKAIKVAAEPDSGVDKLEITIPVEAKKTMLDRTEENIFLFGQGVNVKTDKFGNSPSGIALKFLYSLLDLKTNITERKFKKAIRLFMWFVCEYLNIKDDKKIDYKSIQITFTKSPMINDKEQVDIAAVSTGIVSDETILSNHPWVEDPQEEIKRVKKQMADQDNDPYKKVGEGDEE